MRTEPAKFFAAECAAACTCLAIETRTSTATPSIPPAAVNGGYKVMQEFRRDLSLCQRGHTVFHKGEWFSPRPL